MWGDCKSTDQRDSLKTIYFFFSKFINEATSTDSIVVIKIAKKSDGPGRKKSNNFTDPFRNGPKSLGKLEKKICKIYPINNRLRNETTNFIMIFLCFLKLSFIFVNSNEFI